MKRILLFSVSFLIAAVAVAQAPRFLWDRGISGNRHSLEKGVTSDASGNLITTGFYSSDTLRCGNMKLVNSDPSGLTYNMYVIKYDAAGTVLWAKSFGDSTSIFPGCITADSHGNILIAGTTSAFYGSYITFGGFTTYAISWVIQLDPSGNVTWLRSFTTNQSILSGIACDAAGNVFVSGTFADYYMSMGSGISTDTAVTYYYRPVVMKYSSSGTPVWAKAGHGSSDVYVNSMSVDASGNAIISGYFLDSLFIGTDTLRCTVSGDYGIFLARYDASGALQWVRGGGNIQNNNNDAPKSCMDSYGNAYIGGSFAESSITFGSTTLTNSDPGHFDSYLIKYDTGGNLVWARQVTGMGDFQIQDVRTSPQNSIYTFSNYSGEDNQIDTLQYSAPLTTMTASRFDASGNALWSKPIGGAIYFGSNVLATDPAGRLVIAGQYSIETTFEPGDTLFPYAFTGYQSAYITMLDSVFIPYCFASYTTSYDYGSNVFTIAVDPATAAMAGSYFWDFGDGDTSSLAAPTHIYTHDSLYNVCMTVHDIYGESCTYCHVIGIDSTGAVNRDGGFLLTVANGDVATGISTAAEAPAVMLYPNPGSGIFHLRASAEIQTVAVRDMLGRNVYSIPPDAKGKELTMDLSAQQNGIYFVTVTSAGKSNVLRVCLNK